MKEYSFTKGLGKGLQAVLIVIIAFVAFSGMSDQTVWGMLEAHLKPILGSATVGGLLAMALNYVKVRTSA